MAEYPLLKLQPEKIISLTESLMAVPVTYELGAKVPELSMQAGEFRAVDCSGFLRWCVFHATRATGAELAIPDGSFYQHDWLVSHGYEQVPVSDGHEVDGLIRMAYLHPEDGGGVGHVMLIVNGATCESHGHHGVDRRAWGSQPWMHECGLFVLGMAA